MIVLTLMSYVFHTGFYFGSGAPGALPWALGAVIPVVIFALANLSAKEGWVAKARRAQKVAGESPQKSPAKVAKRWNEISPEERQAMKGLSAPEIANYYGIPARTARDWRKRLDG